MFYENMVPEASLLLGPVGAVRAGELRLDTALVALVPLQVVGFGVGFTTVLAAVSS
jgi:hypothetical protein